jgi:hypothetical protein
VGDAQLFEAAEASEDERDDLTSPGALVGLAMQHGVPPYAVAACDVLACLGPTTSMAVGRSGARPPRLAASAAAARAQRNRQASGRHADSLVDDEADAALNEQTSDDELRDVEASIVALPFENRPGLRTFAFCCCFSYFLPIRAADISARIHTALASTSRHFNELRDGKSADLHAFERDLRLELTRIQVSVILCGVCSTCAQNCFHVHSTSDVSMPND